MADIYPGQSAPDDSEYATRYAMYRRVKTGTLHLLPLNGGYESKRDEDGARVFDLTNLTPRRDDVVVSFVNDVQHAGRKLVLADPDTGTPGLRRGKR